MSDNHVQMSSGNLIRSIFHLKKYQSISYLKYSQFFVFAQNNLTTIRQYLYNIVKLFINGLVS